MLEKIGKYRIDSELGTGAMGVVYKAFDVNIERVVALKTVRTELFRDTQEANDLLARFKNEAQASGRLSHPNIVAIFDFGEAEKIAYLVMEYVKGTPLSSVLVQEKPTDIDVTLSFMSQLLHALDYAHKQGVVHRDIKPANLIITHDAQVKITDFGIARIESSTLTQFGSVIGTPRYMSPEQFRGEIVDGRTDVFAAGVILYRLLTGREPFDGSAAIVMHQILNEPARNPSDVNNDVAYEFNDVIQKALAKSPHERYASAQDFLNALEAAYRTSKLRLGESPEVNDDRTILSYQRTLTESRIIAGKHPIPTYSQGSINSASINTVTPWKIDIQPQLQTILAKHVGPMARVLLKNAMANANNLNEVCNALTPHIPTEKGRSDFLDSLRALNKSFADSAITKGAATSTSITGILTPETQTLLSRTKSLDSHTSISSAMLTPDSEVLEKTESILTNYIGPIAKILTKKTLKQTQNKRELFHLLSLHITTTADRANFLKQVESL